VATRKIAIVRTAVFGAAAGRADQGGAVPLFGSHIFFATGTTAERALMATAEWPMTQSSTSSGHWLLSRETASKFRSVADTELVVNVRAVGFDGTKADP